MKRAIVTRATGFHKELLGIAWPSFETFADMHGWDLIEADLDSPRPPSWHKVPALIQALEDGYQEAVWIDADCVIINPTDDLTAPKWAWQALVEHHTGDGDVPNCGVWLARPALLPTLHQMWGMEKYIHHGWWEQAAMHELLGYVDRRCAGGTNRRERDTGLWRCTHWLDNGWNVHKWDLPVSDRPRIMHASMYDDRAGAMRTWAAAA